jgi:Fe2+ or Zn2+ uptake regulation protein
MEAVPLKIINYCINRNITLSDRKKEVVLVLKSNKSYINAEEVYFQILKRKRITISMPSVYITLNWLVDNGFVEKIEGDDRNRLFKLISD